MKTVKNVNAENKTAAPVNVLADQKSGDTIAKVTDKETAKNSVLEAVPAAEKAAVENTADKKKPGRKPAAKKTTTRKTVKKETTDVKADVFVQYQGVEVSEKAIMEKVVAAWEAEGKKASAIKRAKLYIKPEDGKAYYVINERLKNGSTGAVDL